MQAKLVLLGTKIFIIGHLNPHVKLVRSRLLFRGHFAEYQQIIARLLFYDFSVIKRLIGSRESSILHFLNLNYSSYSATYSEL